MIFFTIVTSNYIPKARVLVESLKNTNPRSGFFLVLCDPVPQGFRPEDELFDGVLQITDLNIPNFDSWVFKHTIVELCTAIKAQCYLKIFETTKEKKIVYLDPDIVVFDSMEELENLLDTHSILLTPHIATPESSLGAILDNEICALKHGVYNLGFIAVAMDNTGLDFLAWWNDRLMNFCYDDIPNGLFTDQRWIDLVPIFFDRVFVLSDPSFNVAPWNIYNRKIAIADHNKITVNNIPLKFFHFSGYDTGACRAMLRKYCPEYETVNELFQRYSDELDKNGQESFFEIPWQYSFFSNMEPILPEHRTVYRNRRDLIEAFPHPARVTTDSPCFYYWFKYEYPKEKPPSVSELTARISELGTQLDGLNTLVERKDSEISSLSVEVERRTAEISGLNTLVERKDTEISSLSVHVERKNAEISGLNTLVERKDTEISALNSRITSIEQSLVWQLTSKFQTTIIGRLFPPGSPGRASYSKIIAHGRLFLARKSEIKKNNPPRYELWIEKNESGMKDLPLQEEESNQFHYKPLISILLPVWETDEPLLVRAIESVIHQTYPAWELCIADGNSRKSHVKRILKRYQKKSDKIRIKFLDENKGISGNTNEALLLANGEFVGFLDHDDELSPDALYEVVRLLQKTPDLDIIYSDSDKIDEFGHRTDPFFKPDWSLPFLLSTNYVFHLLLCRKSLVAKVGGLLPEYDGAQDYDLVLRMIEHTTPERIGHIQKVLYHWRIIKSSSASGGSAKPYAYGAGKRAIEAYIARRGLVGEVSELLPGSYRIKYSVVHQPRVGLALVSKNQGTEGNPKFVRSLADLSDYPIQLVFVPGTMTRFRDDLWIVQHSSFFEDIGQCIQKEGLDYLIFIDYDAASQTLPGALRDGWIVALLEQYLLFKTGVVGTGTPVFGHVVQGIYRPCGPVFCVDCGVYREYLQSTEPVSSFDELQIGLSDFAFQKGYINLYTPFVAANLATEQAVAHYYSDHSSHPFFTHNMDFYLKDVVDGDHRNPVQRNSPSSEIPNPDMRKKIAFEHIRGEGIEIGALHQPLSIPKNVNVKYVDRLRIEDLLFHYPELKNHDIVRPDILDDAETLGSIGNDRYDFCIANHVLEHMKDPIGSLAHWLRVLKPGGILYISIPDLDNPLDTGRKLTTLDHLIADHLDESDARDFQHYLECAQYRNKLSDPEEIRRIAEENYEGNYSIQFHAFDRSLIDRMLSHILSERPDLFKIIDATKNTINKTDEYIYVLEKATYVANCLEILKNHSNAEEAAKPAIDVIVPVYNAYPDLIRCLYSLLKYQTNYRILLINDCSSDPGIHELFEQLRPYESDRFTLLENKENLGFVRTVNLGMQYSHRDVILLNSDTIVTKGWAEKMHSCAYSDDRIGTVTPFTNNGTICSIPYFCENNTIPAGFTIDSYARFIENSSDREYYEIPTAVGFCMLIKRDLIKKIGFFDDEAFGKGYGEENDFCLKAIGAGYRNVLCDDTFVFHQGESSFSIKKAELTKKNMQTLVHRYPDYPGKIADFCRQNPIGPFHRYIQLKADVWDPTERKRRILFVLHHLGGGSEKHVLDLVDTLNSGYICYIVKVAGLDVQLTEFNNSAAIRYEFPLSEPVDGLLSSNERYRSILENILRSFSIDMIHVHHLIGHTMDIFSLAGKLKIPIVFTAHDFYSVCPRINLLDENTRYCHAPLQYEKCIHCLKKTMQLPPARIEEWRGEFSRAFDQCALVIAPSCSVIALLRSYYPNIQTKYRIVEHGHDKALFDPKKPARLPGSSPLFHVAYFGILVPHKGRELFYHLAKDPQFSGRVKWSVFGISDLHPAPGYYPDANITVHGVYHGYHDLLQKVCNDPVDLVFFPQKCPETFSFTLSEAWAMEIPTLVSNLGALKERVEENGGGWTVDMDDVEQVNTALRSILEKGEEYEQKKAEVLQIHLRTLDEAADEYFRIYDSIADEPHKRKMQYVNAGHSLPCRMTRVFSDRDEGTLPGMPTATASGSKKSKFYQRFILCLKDNGMRYTVKRSFSFIQNEVFRL